MMLTLLDPRTHRRMIVVAGGLALAVLAGIAGEWTRLAASQPSWPALGSLLFLIVVGSWFGFSAYLYLLRTMPASRVATYAYVNPVVALGLGAWIGGEPLAALTLAAAGISLAGVYLAVSAR